MKSTLFMIALVVAVVAALSQPLSASAASGSLIGTVKYIKIQDTPFGNNFFLLNTTSTIGRCNMADGATMLILSDNDRNKQMLSLAQSALLAGKTIQVFTDDNGATSGVYCVAKWVIIFP